MVKSLTNPLEIGVEVITKEAEALKKVASSLDEKFSMAVDLLYQMEGKVVLTGLGKSAMIAMKIAATLNSTGTKAQFMHGADAIHGDMGTLSPSDVLMIVSKSGYSSEIEEIVKMAKWIGIPIISITSQKGSILEAESNIFLYVPVEAEACPNNLAPTVSTTAHLAVGDAIAMTLEMAHSFSKEDFRRIHPGGSIGQQLSEIEK